MTPDDSGTAVSAEPASLLEAMTHHLGEALVVVDAGRRLRYANPAARAMLGLPGELNGLRLEDTLADFRLPVMVRTCLAEGQEVVRELDDASDGRHVIARAVPIRPPGVDAPVEVALLLRDESRLRRLETVRRDFVANVSHELRTPVAAIQLLVETLQNGALDEPAVAHEFVGKIGLEVGHMAQMVAELLELSAIESGARPMEPGPVPVAELVAAAERLRPLADERRVALVADIAPGTPPVLGDAGRLGQVVRNLVHNAIKFTPPGGSITLAARTLAEDGRPLAGGDEDTPGRVELRVVDTGCGMAPDEATRVFERFYKADRSRQGEGTGLGLAIAKRLVEAHGGRIDVEAARASSGSVFRVQLPGAT